MSTEQEVNEQSQQLRENMNEQFRIPIRGPRSKKMLAAMQGHPRSRGELADLIQSSPAMVSRFLWRANRKGLIEAAGGGTWVSKVPAEALGEIKPIQRIRRDGLRQQIRDYLKENGVSTTKGIAAAMDVDLQVGKSALQTLKHAGLIRHVGTTRSGLWAAYQRVPRPAKSVAARLQPKVKVRRAKAQSTPSAEIQVMVSGKPMALADAVALYRELERVLDGLRKALP